MNSVEYIVKPDKPEFYSALPGKKGQSVNHIKQMIWVYFFLLIFEGALRKWILPGLSGPLLVIRDPLALYILLNAWYHKISPLSFYSTVMIGIGILSIFIAVLFGHGNLVVALYGARILVIEFPLILVIGHIFDKSDVIKVGNIMLWLSVPMTLLIGLQFFSPQTAWVNRGLGDDATGAGFSGALGFFRPPGTFSFINGTTFFYSMVAGYVGYFLFNLEKTKRLLLICATTALIIAIPFSISRTLIYQVLITFLFILIAVIRKPKYSGKILLGVIIGICAFIILSQTNFFQTSIAASTTRFTSASESEGGVQGTLLNRFLGGLIEAITDSADQPFWGFGIGMGTNAGSALLTGSRHFLIAEGEWGRQVGELGPLLGLSVILLRISLSFNILTAAVAKLKYDDFLPWLILSFSLLLLIQGQWAQPTTLGFSIFGSGLAIASLKTSGKPLLNNTRAAG